MKKLRSKVTYANVISTLCLFLLVGGGTAFAASKLAKNSVGSKQIKNNAITAAKIKNGAVTGSKIKVSSLGTVPSATTAITAASATTATNAANAAHASNADTANTANTATGLSGPLASGKTLTGTFGVAGHKNESSNYIAVASISFQIPLAAPPTFNDLAPGEFTPACPGSAIDPSATPGNFCLYEIARVGALGVQPRTNTPAATRRFGFTVIPEKVAGETNYEVTGVWAVSAP